MIKINSLDIENVKRVKAINLAPSEKGLTIIGGKNGQGKTSVLDAIAWGLGGDKFKPSNPQHEGSLTDPHLHIELSNGLIVERKGKNSALKVIDTAGNKGGQQLLNDFIEQLALNLPKFINSSNKEKADILLQIIGIGDQLYDLEMEEKQLYNRRYEIGRIADQKKKYAEEMTHYEGMPKELISATELIKTQQEILAKNGDNAKKRTELEQLKRLYEMQNAEIQQITLKLQELNSKQEQTIKNLKIAQKTTAELEDESTEALEKNLKDIEEINIKIRANYDKEKAEIEAESNEQAYIDLTAQITEVRDKRMKLLDNAELPLEGLSVEDSELTYKGFKWDNMSSAEQLKIATAIIRKLNPECGFVLIDKLEQMDIDTLKEFSAWLESENLQVIATRVSTGDECSIIIEDGYAKDEVITPNKKIWKDGKF